MSAVDLADKLREALCAIELKAKRRKITDSMEGLLNVLEQASQKTTNPIPEINTELGNEDYLLNMFLTSLGESWKEDIMSLIAQENSEKEIFISEKKLKEKIRTIADKITHIIVFLPNNDLDSFTNFCSLKKQIELLKVGLDK